ncbi:Similar to hypothetical protein [Tuber melanosporum Mel28]; acc. no. XP_002838645 [Pyronema omphalodes CBS 100304]|uniref:Uncharacterized protein n=1 Tax=Pyronema omphalodes (strain CBS 100304) TaxID=1076935 RepID=U4LP70_PYROM|nr:Similar to hypothetical protein [Tuber melanosporum Mel28]; acc. no. XP_002838645 [Pyronema omphalodes CBS 100304]
MPTTRPFLANLLIAFRAHSAATQTPPSQNNNQPGTKSSSTSAKPVTATSSTSTSATAAVAAAAASAQSAAQSTSSMTSPTSPVQPTYTANRGRRSSSSSTEGFVEPPSGEKWWIGGRNSDGQERFYRLQPV